MDTTPKEIAETEDASTLEPHSKPDLSGSDFEVDLDATLTPARTSSPLKDDSILFSGIEEELEKQLQEKALKSKLTVKNVKTIIRQVFNNEHVRALFDKHDKDPETSMCDDLVPFEPKLTRAKAKELLSSNSIPVPPVNIPWVSNAPVSETQVLIGEDLKEDDSGDEYVPGEEESEDDKDGSVTSESDVSSLPPPTPPMAVSTEDHATQTTSYTDDGVFKIPPPKSTQEESLDEATNIALRTRSKINLSSTPLEVIEKSFVPPDVTLDMYDMECDDDDWKQFLQGFTEPLEEIIKRTEEPEDQDPEYNIMADDEINQIDNEDFRVDKAVKITKKEVKELWEELFEFLDNASGDDASKTNDDLNISLLPDVSNSTNTNVLLSENVDNSQNNCSSTNVCEDPIPATKENEKQISLASDLCKMSSEQMCILEQQMRQHVQILTQNFLLTYEHPEYHSYSVKFKEYLLNLKFLSVGKIFSWFRPQNLIPAVQLIQDWIETFSNPQQGEIVKKTKEHVRNELMKSIQYKMTGNWQYLVTFPELMLEIVSKSEVFLYPALLPKIPFKSDQFTGSRTGFTDAEDNLLVFGLDMFEKFLCNESEDKKKVNLKLVVANVQQYMMPHRSKQVILKHIYQSKHPRCASNPIQQYMLYKKLKPMLHYIYPVNQVVPPCRRLPEELPEQWRNFIYPSGANQVPQNQRIFVLASPFPASSIFPSPIPKSPQASPKNIKVPKRVRNPTSKQKETSLLIKIVNNRLDTDSSEGKKANRSVGPLIKQTVRSPSTGAQNSACKLNTTFTSFEHFVSIFLTAIDVHKLVSFLAEGDKKYCATETLKTPTKQELKHFSKQEINLPAKPNTTKMASNMPSLNTPIKEPAETLTLNCSVSSTTLDDCRVELSSNTLEGHKKPETITSNTTNEDNRRPKVTRNLEFSTITSSSFQKANTSTEVEFCRNSSDIQICQTSQSDEQDIPNSSGYSSGCGKDNPEDINALLIASSTVSSEVKSNKKKLSTAERKKNKLRKDFLTNLSVATPDDPESEKHRNEMFAVAYYDKLRETLELDDYNRIMHILNEFESGDVVDLYKDIQTILCPKYMELADDFLFFLREKEASAVGQLIPWLELQTRVKFLRKLEIYLKDQPTQLKRIYNTLMELAKGEDTTMEKVKSVLVPMLKGNKILLDLFLQSFKDERPPPSLLEGPYETIDINKELARPCDEEIYETFVVPNTEDKYGGPNCICHCHKIEDNEYKSRYKHCNSCGLKFANGKLYLATGRLFQPATVTFKTNSHINHNIRLMGKSAMNSGVKKKRSDVSPNKLASSSTKESLEEDTEDEDLGKRKKSISQRTPRKRKKVGSPKYQEDKSVSPKKSPARNWELIEAQKELIKPRRRTYSGKKSRKDENKKTDNKAKVDEIRAEVPNSEELNEDFGVAETLEELAGEQDQFESKHKDEAEKEEERERDQFEETLKDDGEKDEEGIEIVAEIEESEHETSEENPGKSTDDCMDSSGESLEKPLTPGQQTTESETELYIEESSQDNYESDDSMSSSESAKGSQSDSNTIDEPPWQREEDTIILETLQKEDDKEYALQIISDKLPNRTVGQIRSRLSRLMDLLIETLKNT